jgi:acyl carrier protein
MQDRSNAVIDAGICASIRAVKPSLENHFLEPETKFSSLGLDSMNMLTVAFEMEERFGVSIVDRHLDTFRTLQEARETVQGLLESSTVAKPAS